MVQWRRMRREGGSALKLMMPATVLATVSGLAYLRATGAIGGDAAFASAAGLAAAGALGLAAAAARERELRRRLDETRHERSEILSIVSHQMRTPLAAMRWIIETLLRGDAGELSREQRGYVTDLLEANGRLTGLVNDMLNASRLESGQHAAAPAATDLRGLLKEAAKEIAPLAKEKRQTLRSRLPRTPLVASVDARMFKQAVLNLLSNAVKYTPQRGRVVLEAEREGEVARIRVQDDGIGIPPGQQADIFKKFYRADNAVASGAEGTGLGLYVVRKVVEQAGGTVTLESAQGKGSTFTIALPLKRR